MNERDETALGRVVEFPERLPERQVFDAEIVEDDHLPVLARQRDLAHARWRAYRASAATVVHTTRTAATHERTRTASKAVLRHALYVLAGALTRQSSPAGPGASTTAGGAPSAASAGIQ